MKQIESAGIVVYRIVRNTIEYLLLRYTAGHWDFPKGRLEIGETQQEAALRELHEETGLSATLHDGFFEQFSYTLADYHDGKLAKKTAYFFLGQANGSDVKLSHEHTDFVWMSYQSALQRLTYHNAQQLLTKANAFLQHSKKQ